MKYLKTFKENTQKEEKITDPKFLKVIEGLVGDRDYDPFNCHSTTEFDLYGRS